MYNDHLLNILMKMSLQVRRALPAALTCRQHGTSNGYLRCRKLEAMNDFSEKNMDSVASCNWFKGSDIGWHPTLVLMKFRCEPRAAYKFTANAHGSWEAHGDMFTAKSWKVEVKPQKSQANRKPFPKKNMTISHPMTIRWHPAMTLVSYDEILKPRATAASNSLQFWDAIDAYLRHMAEVFSRVTRAWNYFINTCNDFVRLDACDASLQTHVNEAWNLYHCMKTWQNPWFFMLHSPV